MGSTKEPRPRSERGEPTTSDRGIGAIGGTAADGNTFFRTGLASGRGTTPTEERRWRRRIFEAIKQEMQMQGGSLTIREMCETSAVSRASYYRSWQKGERGEEQVALRDAIQRLAIKDRHCGYRRITRLLKRDGWVVNHKRILRLMRADNLLSIRRRRFVITTDSNHSWRVYPNLARRMEVSASSKSLSLTSFAGSAGIFAAISCQFFGSFISG